MALILAIFNLERQIILEIDVFNYTIGMCISQSNLEGWLQPITFYLQKMIPIELNYKIYNKELLIIVKAFQN
jgi:RNase H-like domain found in reverse transcriptase